MLGSASIWFSRELPSDLTSPPSMYTRTSSQSVCFMGSVDNACRGHTHACQEQQVPKISKKDTDLTIGAIHGPSRLTLHLVLCVMETWHTVSPGAAGHWSLPCMTFGAAPLGRPPFQQHSGGHLWKGLMSAVCVSGPTAVRLKSSGSHYNRQPSFQCHQPYFHRSHSGKEAPGNLRGQFQHLQ